MRWAAVLLIRLSVCGKGKASVLYARSSCWHDTYQGAPTDGSAWVMTCTDDSRRVRRGGSWLNLPLNLRATSRNGLSKDNRSNYLGFRIARTLTP